MAHTNGYAVIRGAVRLDLIQEAAVMISKGSLKVIYQRVKYNEFEVPGVCSQIRDEFMASSDKAPVAALLDRTIVPTPKHINIGIFHESNPDPTKAMTAGEGKVYVTVALTDLNPKTGWFVLLKGSHRRESKKTISIAQWEQVSLDVKAGDAIVWRGDLGYLHSSGGGGSFMTIVFV
ncbi:MAG: hypothetical protein Q9217_006664 [Psora testacea]